MSREPSDRELVRHLYNAWWAGAGLKRDDLRRLSDKANLGWSNNRLRNAGQDGDRASPITLAELLALMQERAKEQMEARGTGSVSV